MLNIDAASVLRVVVMTAKLDIFQKVNRASNNDLA